MKTPYFEMSKRVVLEQYAKVKGISDVVSYSSKTNPLVTPIIEERTDGMFSVHLVEELRHVKDCSRVLFLAQGLNDAALDKVFLLGVSQFVIDNEVDLRVLLSYLDRTGKRIRLLLLRVKLQEFTIKTERYFVFGIPGDRVKTLVDDIFENVHVEKVGVHFHRKTQNMSEWNLKYELTDMFDDSFFEKIDMVNIGGGLPSVYANTNDKVVDSIIDKIQTLREFLYSKNVLLMIEPGRFICAPAVKLVTRVSLVYDSTVVVDASVYNSDMDALIVPVKLLVDGEFSKEDALRDDSVRSYVIKGKTPCSLDLFRYKVYLRDVAVSDTIVFLNAGAYSFSTDFCDLEKIPTVVVD